MSLKSAACLASQLLLWLVDSVNIYSTGTHFSVRSAEKFISPVIASDYYFTATDRLLPAFRDFKNNTIWFLTLTSRLTNATHTISNTFFMQHARRFCSTDVLELILQWNLLQNRITMAWHFCTETCSKSAMPFHLTEKWILKLFVTDKGDMTFQFNFFYFLFLNRVAKRSTLHA